MSTFADHVERVVLNEELEFVHAEGLDEEEQKIVAKRQSDERNAQLAYFARDDAREAHRNAVHAANEWIQQLAERSKALTFPHRDAIETNENNKADRREVRSIYWLVELKFWLPHHLRTPPSGWPIIKWEYVDWYPYVQRRNYDIVGASLMGNTKLAFKASETHLVPTPAQLAREVQNSFGTVLDKSGMKLTVTVKEVITQTESKYRHYAITTTKAQQFDIPLASGEIQKIGGERVNEEYPNGF